MEYHYKNEEALKPLLRKDMQDIVNIKAEHAHIYVKRALIHYIHTQWLLAYT